MTDDMTAARLLGLTTAATGAAGLFAGRATARATGRAGGMPDPRIVRVLGARQLVQGLVTVAVPTSDVLVLGAAVDTAHAASMLPLVLASRRFRRPAALSATLAAATAAMAWRLSRR